MYYLFFVIGWIEGNDIIVNGNTTNKLIATMDCAFKILINVYLLNVVYIYFIDKFIFNCFIDPNYVTVVNTFIVSMFYYHSLQYV